MSQQQRSGRAPIVRSPTAASGRLQQRGQSAIQAQPQSQIQRGTRGQMEQGARAQSQGQGQSQSQSQSQGQGQGQMQTQRQPSAVAGLTLDEALTGEMRLALHDFVQSATACEWCAERCIDEGQGMEECIRLCRDVADLALQNVRFIARDSVFGPDAAETFAYAAEECARECERHQHAHCQECATVLRRAVNSTWELLESAGHRPQQGSAQTQSR